MNAPVLCFSHLQNSSTSVAINSIDNAPISSNSGYVSTNPLVIKGESNQLATLSLVNSLITVYDNIEPFTTVEERDNYQLQYTSGLVETYPELDDIGALSIELIATLVELFCKCEKQSTGAFMFRSMLTLTKEYLEGKKDYYQIIGTSKRV